MPSQGDLVDVTGVRGDAPTTVVPLIVRGKVIVDDLVEFSGRGDSLSFYAPDPHRYLPEIALSSPAMLRDLYELGFDEILDYLEELGSRLDISTNRDLEWARELTYATSDQTKPLIDNEFKNMARMFDRKRVREMADETIGIGYLEGWVDSTLDDGTISSVRAFGARSVHVVPGNSATAAASTIIKNAVTRGDCIIKSPSNNPFAGVAIVRTMVEMAPDHPITKHVTIGYWRGGDVEFERRLYQPHNVEKIVAWGGFASVKHVTQYIQPGLELISLDPKYSISVVGPDALSSEEQLREAALRLAVDIGTRNQTSCSCARVVYVVTGDLADGLERVNKLGEYVYEELVALPDGMSTKPKSYNPELRSNIESLRLQDDWYKVIGGEDGEGCIVVSQLADPVDFTSLLADRTANLVPVDTVEDVLPRIDSYTQTIGVYPEHLKSQLLDIAPLFGAQRFVTLGYAAHPTASTPHDGLELERRLCKWIVNLRSQPIPLTFAATREADGTVESDVVPGTLEAVRARR